MLQTLRKLLFLIPILFFFGCFEEGDCLDNETTLLKIKFINAADNTDLSVNIQNITMEGSNSVFYSDTTVTEVVLPLNPNADHTNIAFSFATDDKNATFQYTAYPKVIGLDCGIDYNFKNLEVTNSDFDNLVIVNSILDKSTSTNVEIYR